MSNTKENEISGPIMPKKEDANITPKKEDANITPKKKEEKPSCENLDCGNGYSYHGYCKVEGDKKIPDGDGEFYTIRNGKKVSVKKGIFKNGYMTLGIYFSPSGLIQFGHFNKQGNLNGKGCIFLRSGAYLSGTWDNGEPKGKFSVFFGVGRKPMEYDFSDRNHGNFNITIHSHCIIIYDKYLLSTNDRIIIYFNGDIFLGQTDNLNPTMGNYYKLINNKYYTITLGDSSYFSAYKISNIECSYDNNEYNDEFANAIITMYA